MTCTSTAPPTSRDVASSWLGIMAENDSDADIFDQTLGGPNSKKGSKALSVRSLLCEREQGARTSEPHENCITSGSPLCRGLTRVKHPQHRASETDPSQSGIKPGTSCTESVATLPPFGPVEGQKWFDRISSQWESQKNRFALIYFGKIRFLPPCISNIPFMSYSLCRRTLYAKSHSNGVVNCYSEPRLVLLQHVN